MFSADIYLNASSLNPDIMVCHSGFRLFNTRMVYLPKDFFENDTFEEKNRQQKCTLQHT